MCSMPLREADAGDLARCVGQPGVHRPQRHRVAPGPAWGMAAAAGAAGGCARLRPRRRINAASAGSSASSRAARRASCQGRDRRRPRSCPTAGGPGRPGLQQPGLPPGPGFRAARLAEFTVLRRWRRSRLRRGCRSLMRSRCQSSVRSTCSASAGTPRHSCGKASSPTTSLAQHWHHGRRRQSRHRRWQLALQQAAARPACHQPRGAFTGAGDQRGQPDAARQIGQRSKGASSVDGPSGRPRRRRIQASKPAGVPGSSGTSGGCWRQGRVVQRQRGKAGAAGLQAAAAGFPAGPASGRVPPAGVAPDRAASTGAAPVRLQCGLPCRTVASIRLRRCSTSSTCASRAPRAPGCSGGAALASS
jgi:hypothetical protein